jgi:hypothetical protein
MNPNPVKTKFTQKKTVNPKFKTANAVLCMNSISIRVAVSISIHQWFQGFLHMTIYLAVCMAILGELLWCCFVDLAFALNESAQLAC